MKFTLLPALAAVLILAAGCQSTRQITDYGPRYQPRNVTGVSNLPPTLRRVALLPVAPHRESTTMTEGTEPLSSVLETELRKTQLFEIVRVSPQQLQQWTGRSAWRIDEALPPSFLSRIETETACSGVLFASLTAFRPYPPLAVGWDLRLVDVKSEQILWAVDEVLDSGSAPVARSAKDYSEAQLHGGRAGDEATVLQSPRRFGQFAAATLVATLPGRQLMLK